MNVADSIDSTNEPTESHRLKRKAANKALLVEEEVETLWGKGEDDEEEEEELLSPITAHSHGLAVDRLEASFNSLAHRTQEWSAFLLATLGRLPPKSHGFLPGQISKLYWSTLPIHSF